MTTIYNYNGLVAVSDMIEYEANTMVWLYFSSKARDS